jgi:predicted peptidase
MPTTLQSVKELLDTFIANNPIDPNRIYIMGLSMGGMGTFEMVCRFPDLFAAAIPICGGVNIQRLKEIETSTAFRIFHGDADAIVPVAFSRDAYTTLKAKDVDVQYIEFPGINHDSWTPAFNRDDFMEWLFMQ